MNVAEIVTLAVVVIALAIAAMAAVRGQVMDMANNLPTPVIQQVVEPPTVDLPV